MSHAVAIRRRVMVAVVALVAASIGAASWWQCDNEKRRPRDHPRPTNTRRLANSDSIARIIRRERIKTIITLTAINGTDPKYISQAKVVAETGVRWQIVPMHGSRATMNRWRKPRICSRTVRSGRSFSIASPATTAPVWPTQLT